MVYRMNLPYDYAALQDCVGVVMASPTLTAQGQTFGSTGRE
jgi:hypothetical protein